MDLSTILACFSLGHRLSSFYLFIKMHYDWKVALRAVQTDNHTDIQLFGGETKKTLRKVHLKASVSAVMKLKLK